MMARPKGTLCGGNTSPCRGASFLGEPVAFLPLILLWKFWACTIQYGAKSPVTIKS